MWSKYGLFLGLAVSISGWGCQRPLPIALPFEGERLVLYGIMSPEQPFSLRVSRTFPPTTAGPVDESVLGALVTVWEDSLVLDTLVFGQDQYVSAAGRMPLPGASYQFRVEAPNFPPAYSQPVRLPRTALVTGLALRDSSFVTGNSQSVGGVIRVDFVDPPPGEDYYWLEATSDIDERENAVGECLGGNISAGCFSSEDIRCLFSDACFQTTEVFLQMGIETAIRTRTGVKKATQIRISLAAISPGLFQYYQSASQPIGIEWAFAEPGNLFSNIEGGYGFIGAQVVTYDTLFLD